jgi:hypothetical protein
MVDFAAMGVISGLVGAVMLVVLGLLALIPVPGEEQDNGE